MPTEQKIENTKTRSRSKRIRKMIMRFLWASFLLIVIAIFSFNYAINQEWGTKKVEALLTDKLKTKVDIYDLHFNIFKGVEIHDLLINDHTNDTLFYAQAALMNFAGNPLNLLQGEFSISKIELTDFLISNVTYKGDSLSSYSHFINQFKETNEDVALQPPSNAEPGGSNFEFKVKKLLINNGTLVKSDLNSNKYESYKIHSLHADVDSINLGEKRFTFHSINLNTPIVNIDKAPYELDDQSYVNPQEDEEEYPEDDEMDEDEDGELSNDLEKKPGLIIISKSITMENGYFEFNDYRSTISRHLIKDAIDFRHLMVHDIDMNIHDFSMEDLDFKANFTHASMREESGFQINSFCVGDGQLNGSNLTLNDMELYTPYSSIGDTFKINYDGYPSYLKYVDEVFMKTKMVNSTVGIRDIMFFAHKLRNHHFFEQNEYEKIDFSGRAFGFINNLKTRNVNLRMSDKILFSGNIDIRDVTEKGEQLLNVKAKKLQAHVTTISNIITEKPLSSNLTQLGNISFTGQFDGFFQNFVSFGKLQSELGNAEMDMKLNTRGGLVNATYSGALDLIDFDLGTYVANPKIGLVNFTSSVKEGKGLSLESAQANLNATVYNINYNDYTYRDILFDGILNNELIDGKVEIHDPNIDFDFEGLIKNINTLPYFDFKANINTLKTKALNFTKNDISFSGDLDVEFEGLDPDILEGSLVLHDIQLTNDKDTFNLNNANIVQHSLNQQIRTLTVESNILDLNVSGNYLLTKLHKDVFELIHKTHPSLGEMLNFPKYDLDTIHRFYTITADVKKTKNMLSILTGQSINLNDVSIKGFYYGGLDSMGLTLNTPSFGYNNLNFTQIEIDAINGPNTIKLDVKGHHFILNEKTWFKEFDITSFSINDTIKSQLFLDNNAYSFEDFDINLIFYPIDEISGYGIKFLPSNIVEHNRNWVFNPANQIFYGKKHLDIRELSLRSEDRQISVENFKDEGIELLLSNFHLNMVDSILPIHRLDFEGYSDVRLKIDDVFKLKGFQGQITSSNLEISDIPLGNMIIDYQMKDLQSPLHVWLNTSHGQQTLNSNGQILIGALQKPKSKFTQYRFNVNFKNYPLSALEIVIPNGITGTQGRLDGKLQLTGANNKPKLVGDATVYDGQTMIDYLGTTYYFDNQKILLTEKLWDFTGAKLKDRLGNEATIRGGIKHRYLKDYSMDATIRSDKIIALNTTLEQNPDYYGYAIGEIEVDFQGPFKNIDIYLKATTGATSSLNIPVSTKRSDQNKSNFIYFTKVDSSNLDNNKVEQSGLNFAMDLAITEEATTSIIFDEEAGDILRGNGTGNIRLTVDPRTNISMYGSYDVVKGNYLFTLFNLVNKPFIVRPGGTIRWSGDPLDAQLNIEAVYDGLSAPLEPLIHQYIQNESQETREEAEKVEKIELEMKLTGKLFSPQIEFDIFFPELTGKLRSYATAEMSSIRQNQAKLNQQVFGLIVLGGFLPSSGFAQQSIALPSVISTMTELISHNLSNVVTGLLKNATKKLDFVSGMSFNLDYNQINSILGSEDPNYQPTSLLDGELNFEVQTRLFKDRVELTYKGAFSNSPVAGNPYYNNTVVVELLRTGVTGLRFRLYTDEDIYLTSPRQTFGIGTTFRKEFDSFKSKKKRKKAKEDAVQKEQLK